MLSVRSEVFTFTLQCDEVKIMEAKGEAKVMGAKL
jgi:hypothetical protein